VASDTGNAAIGRDGDAVNKRRRYKAKRRRALLKRVLGSATYKYWVMPSGATITFEDLDALFNKAFEMCQSGNGIIIYKKLDW
jgi:hypothetical protein